MGNGRMRQPSRTHILYKVISIQEAVTDLKSERNVYYWKEGKDYPNLLKDIREFDGKTLEVEYYHPLGTVTKCYSELKEQGIFIRILAA
jgi:hypothetical protein